MVSYGLWLCGSIRYTLECLLTQSFTRKPEKLLLEENRLKVWAVNLDGRSGDLALLSRDERLRAHRLRRPEDRERSLEAHCAIRRILALELGVDPRCLEFDTTTAGKPFLARPAKNLEFNLSHSGRHGLVAVAKDRSVGVDIEIRRPVSDLLGVALQIATPHEIKLLRHVPASQVQRAFFDLWTRKEAVLKAIGVAPIVTGKRTGRLISPLGINFRSRATPLRGLFYSRKRTSSARSLRSVRCHNGSRFVIAPRSQEEAFNPV